MRPRILVVDDEEEIVEFLCTLLTLEGFDARPLPHGSELGQAAQHADVVVMDISMPQLDGLRACRILKDDPRTAGVPVVLVSARPGHEVIEEAREAGAAAFLRKPFENEQLVALLREQLR